MHTFLYGPGTRVRVRRGAFPLDPTLLGRTGLIVALHDVRRRRYGVTLDGEGAIRDLAEDELEPVEAGTRPREELGATGPGVGPSPSGGSGGQS